jgi:hypothetical protein
MGYVLSNIAREVGKQRRWRDKFWARRYSAIVVSDEESAQVARLRYILSQGVKEGFVATPEEWPGANCADALRTGSRLCGTWYDRTAELIARRMGLDVTERDFATIEDIRLTPLACWASWSPAVLRQGVSNLIASVVQEANQVRCGRPPLGREGVLRQDPRQCPRQSARRIAPDFHAASRAGRERLRIAYASFVQAFRLAATRLRAGFRAAHFPAGSFPPALPFVALDLPGT